MNVSFDGSKYITDYMPEQQKETLNTAKFFRVNRQFIINLSAIVRMMSVSKSRLRFGLVPNSILKQ
jgi:DNA-binding LytR/AlgR family response regulator